MKTLSLFLFVIAAIASTNVSAQKRTGQNLLNLSYTPQYYLNKSYIENDETLPNPLTTENTFGYNIGLEYQRVTRYGLSLSGGVQYGQQRHSLSVNYDVTDFDPRGSISLSSGNNFSVKYDATLKFLSNRFMIGYVWPWQNEPNAKWSLEGRLGWASKTWFNKYTRATSYSVVYQDDINPNLIYTRRFTAITHNLGNAVSDDKININPSKNTYLQTLEFYLGVRRNLNFRWLKTLNIGLEYATTYYKNDVNHARYYAGVKSVDVNGNVVSSDYYFDKNRSIGIRIAAGLWR